MKPTPHDRHRPRIDPDHIPEHVLDVIVTRLAADLAAPTWCQSCQDRPARIGRFCIQCLPDDTDFK